MREILSRLQKPVCHLLALGLDTATENPICFYSLGIPDTIAPSAEQRPTPPLKLLLTGGRREAIISAPDHPQVGTAETKSKYTIKAD